MIRRLSPEDFGFGLFTECSKYVALKSVPEEVKKQSLIFGVPIIVMALAVSPLHAQPGLFSALFRIQPSKSPLNGSDRRIAAPTNHVSNRPKSEAVVLGLGQTTGQRVFRIQIASARQQRSELVFVAKESFAALASRDVNRDGAVDLVVEQSLTRKPLRVWLNDGYGNFRQARTEEFLPSGREPPHHVGALPSGKDDPARRMRVKRGTKLMIERAQMPSTRDSSPRQPARPLASADRQEPKGPNPSRAPPFFFL
jgi:hypothetical protein